MNMERSMFWCESVATAESLQVARQKRRQYTKRDVNTRTETLIHENGPTKETNTYLQTELWREGRCVGCRGMRATSKETYVYMKRDVCMCMTRHVPVCEHGGFQESARGM